MINKIFIISGVLLYLLCIILGHSNINGLYILLLWFISIAIIFMSVFKIKVNKTNFSGYKLFESPKERYLFIIVMLVGLFFGFYKLYNLPFGLWLDEILFSQRALELSENLIPCGLFQTNPMVREDWVVFNNLFLYYVLILFKVLGVNYWSIKIVSLLPSFGIIAGSYFLFRYASKNYYLALIAMFLTATSHWFITISRWGWNEVFMSMLQIVSYFLVIKGIEEKNNKYLCLAGILLGLTFYTYIAFNIVFIILLLFSVILLFINKKDYKNYLKRLSIVFITAIIIILPGSIDYIKNPDSFFVRIKEVSIINHIKKEKSIKPLLVSTVNHLKMFNIQGDIIERHNTAKKPQLNFISGILFLIGLIICIYNIKKSYNYLFLIWFVLGLSGGIVSAYNEGPHAYRTALIIPVVMYFCALSLIFLYNVIKLKANKKASLIIIIVILLVIMGLDYNTYFNIRPASMNSYNSTLNPDDIIVARRIKQLRLSTPGVPVFVVNDLLLKSDTARLLNYKKLTYNPDVGYSVYGVRSPDFSILMNYGINLFGINNDAFYLVYPSNCSFIIDYIYRKSKITPIINPFGKTIAFTAYVTRENISNIKPFEVKKSYPENNKSILCVVTILKNKANIDIKRLYKDIVLEINGNNVFTENELSSEITLSPNQLFTLKIIGPYTPDNLLNNILVKDQRVSKYTKINSYFKMFDFCKTNGLTAKYYNNSKFEGRPYFEGIVLSFNIFNSKRIKHMSATWDGFLNIKKEGEYLFKIKSPNEFALYIDGSLIIDSNKENTINLTKGPHKIHIKYAKIQQKEGFRFFWKTPNNNNFKEINFEYLNFKEDKNFCG